MAIPLFNSSLLEFQTWLTGPKEMKEDSEIVNAKIKRNRKLRIGHRHINK